MIPDTRLLEQLKKTLQTLPPPYYLALSGGIDSMVLLEGLFRLGAVVTVIHVHHGLQADADDWLAFCHQQAAQRQFAFDAVRVQLPPGGNIEAKARQARYAAFEQRVGSGTLLTAQHQDDNAETLLLGLMRGAGVAGLGGMVASRLQGQMTVARPLLDVSRQSLEALAKHWQLVWVEDPSNQDERFERNWVRHALLPVWQQHQPGIKQQLAHSARLLAQADGLLDELAALDRMQVQHEQGGLHIERLDKLGLARQHNVLRFWLADKLPYRPGEEWLERLRHEVLQAAVDALPKLTLAKGVVTRHRSRLVWLPDAVFDVPSAARWTMQKRLHCGHLQLSPETPAVADEGHCSGQLLIDDHVSQVDVAFARGGETLLLGGMHRKVSECWRAAGVPPWLRAWLPLFFVRGELVAVAAIGVADGWQPKHKARAIHWSLPTDFWGQ